MVFGHGRPKGVPNKATREIKEIARHYGPAVIEGLYKLATSAVSESARVAATKELLDRAYGKAPQAIEHSGAIGSYDLTRISDVALAQLEAILANAAIESAGRVQIGASGEALMIASEAISSD